MLMRPFGRIFMLFCLPECFRGFCHGPQDFERKCLIRYGACQPYGLAERTMASGSASALPRSCRCASGRGGRSVRASLAQWPSRIRTSYLNANVICPKW